MKGVCMVLSRTSPRMGIKPSSIITGGPALAPPPLPRSLRVYCYFGIPHFTDSHVRMRYRPNAASGGWNYGTVTFSRTDIEKGITPL